MAGFNDMFMRSKLPLLHSTMTATFLRIHSDTFGSTITATAIAIATATTVIEMGATINAMLATRAETGALQ